MVKLLIGIGIHICIFAVIPLWWEPVFPPSFHEILTLNNSISFIWGWWGFMFLVFAFHTLFLRRLLAGSPWQTSCVILATCASPLLLYLAIPVYVSEQLRTLVCKTLMAFVPIDDYRYCFKYLQQINKIFLIK